MQLWNAEPGVYDDGRLGKNSNIVSRMEGRNRNIDGLKGFLIVMVILGHVLQGKILDNFGRYVIYSFHMPLFVGLSGYLLNIDSIRPLKIGELFSKFSARLILPWAVAMVAYAVYLGAFALHPTPLWKGWVNYLLNPFYHLWFVVGYIFWNVVSWILLRLGFDRRGFLIVAILVGWIFYYMKNNLEGQLILALGGEWAGFVRNILRPQLFFFFGLGVYLRGEQIPTKSWVFALGGATVMGLYWTLFYFHRGLDYNTEDFLVVMANAFLMVPLFRWMHQEKLPRVGVLEWVGEHSLGIYLWHVLPLLWVKDWVGTKYLSRFYCYISVTELVFLGVVYLLLRYVRVSRWVLG
jgi:fucose 4-O-acetylase-like acetyltransferase